LVAWVPCLLDSAERNRGGLPRIGQLDLRAWARRPITEAGQVLL
jgi:hypothetical protein